MKKGWLAYAVVFSLLTVAGAAIAPLTLLNLVNSIISIILCAAVFLYSLQKPILSQDAWKIIFWLTAGTSLIWTSSSLISTGANSEMPFSAMTFLTELLLVLPAYIVMYWYAYTSNIWPSPDKSISLDQFSNASENRVETKMEHQFQATNFGPKTVWGVIAIVLSVCLFLFSGFQLWQISNAESQINAMNSSSSTKSVDMKGFYKAAGVDIDAQLMKGKLLYMGLFLASIGGAIFGTKLLQKPS